MVLRVKLLCDILCELLYLLCEILYLLYEVALAGSFLRVYTLTVADE